MDNPDNAPTTTSTPRKRLHPLVATAIGAVIVASLAATAAITGVLPKAGSTPAADIPPATVDTAAPASGTARPATLQAQPPAQTPAPMQAQAQAAAPVMSARAPAQTTPAAAPRYAPPHAQQPPAEPRAPVCDTCGTVVAITETRTEGHGTGLGALGGAAAGGLVGNQFGRGGGRTAMTILGALGGGLAGNSVEKHLRSETDYQVRVHMENGTTRTFTYRNPPPFGQGQRVHVEQGALVAG